MTDPSSSVVLRCRIPSPRSKKNGFDANPKTMSQPPSTMMLEAVAQGDIASVYAHLESGVSVECKDANGDSALANAAFNGHLDVLKLLLGTQVPTRTLQQGRWRHGADVGGVTGRLDIVVQLLRAGANVNAENKKGYPGLYRQRQGSRRAGQAAPRCRRRAKAVNAHEKTVLDQAREWQQLEIIEVLEAWQTLDGCELIKRQFPEVASNFVSSSFVSGNELAARLSPPMQRRMAT